MLFYQKHTTLEHKHTVISEILSWGLSFLPETSCPDAKIEISNFSHINKIF